jgi:hypothetical protein
VGFSPFSFVQEKDIANVLHVDQFGIQDNIKQKLTKNNSHSIFAGQ